MLDFTGHHPDFDITVSSAIDGVTEVIITNTISDRSLSLTYTEDEIVAGKPETDIHTIITERTI